VNHSIFSIYSLLTLLYPNYKLSNLYFMVSISTAAAQEMAEEIVSIKGLPQYSFFSYFLGLVIMLAFVVAPVGMMAYRNRNSIVEFLKNR